jgi:protein-tyrosine phosphatase
MNYIIAQIFLGNIADAVKTSMDTLYVHEDFVPDYEPTHHVPIIQWSEPELEVGDFFGGHKDPARKKLVDPKKLEEAHAILDRYYNRNEQLLIHCLGGIERSPLTLATWMLKHKMYPNLDEAYIFLKKQRPIVADRRHWLGQPI